MIVDYTIPTVAGTNTGNLLLGLFVILIFTCLPVILWGNKPLPSRRQGVWAAVLFGLAWVVFFTSLGVRGDVEARQAAVDIEHYAAIAVEAGYEDVTVVDESVVGLADDGSIVEIHVTRLDGDPERYAVEEVTR